MRKILTTLTAAAVTLAVLALPASALLVPPTPAAGTISGTQTFSDNGATATGVSQLFGPCPGRNTISWRNSSNAVLSSLVFNGTGAEAVAAAITIDTESFANGGYNIFVQSQKGRSLLVACNSLASATTQQINYTVANPAKLQYTGAGSGATGSTVNVQALLTSVGGKIPTAGQTVSFKLADSTTTVSATTNASGLATASLPISGAPRTTTLTVTSTAGYYNAGVATPAPSFEVLPIPTTTSISATPGATVFGQTTTLNASVVQGFGSTVPTGSVQFKIDGADFGAPVSLSGGGTASTVTLPTLSVASHAISAVYAPTGNFGTSTGDGTLVVSKASTTLSVSPSLDPIVFGQPVSFSAHVGVVSPGAGTPTGNVTFQVDGDPVGPPVAIDASGNATSTQTTLAAKPGPYVVTATYVGDGSFNGSTATSSLQVNKASTSTSVSSSSTPSVTGQSVQFSSTVSANPPGAGTPTGSVTYDVDGSPLGGAVTLSGSGQAVSDGIASLAPGDHLVTVSYGGDSNFVASSMTFTQHVDKAQTDTTLGQSVNPSVFGQPVTFSATVVAVAPGTGTPSGTVTFVIDGTPRETVALNASGAASAAPISDLSVGTHDVSAQYSGDDGYVSSAEARIQTVNKAATTTDVTSSVNPSLFGQTVTFDATVTVPSPGAGTPSGTVTFLDGATVLSVQPLAGVLGSGTASFTTNALSVGTHAITTAYSGDGNFEGSSGNVTQGVNKAQSTTVVAPNAPIVQGQPVTFTASVAAVAPGSGIPTGTVKFTLNGAQQGAPVALDALGNATSVAITGLTPGNFHIVATYSGSGQFLPSTGDVGQAVSAGVAITTLTQDSASSAFGAPVTLIAKVVVGPPAVGLPTGSVAFYDGGALLGVGELADGPGGNLASFTVSDLAVGAHSLTATYLGDFNFAGSDAGPLAHTVQGDPTTTVVTSSPNPSLFGSTVTITATVTKSLPNAASLAGTTVSFFDGPTLIGTAATNAAGQASITKANFTVGTHGLKASYPGTSVYGASTSAVANQVVAKAPTMLTTSYAGSVITATLTSAQGGISGQTLQVASGTNAICTITTGATGAGTCTIGFDKQLTILLGGGYTVTYAGNGSYLPTNASGHA